jgi:hypothetical protein
MRIYSDQEHPVPNCNIHSRHRICPATMLKPLILGLLQATGTFATWTAYQEYVQSHNMSVRTHESDRPSLLAETAIQEDAQVVETRQEMRC